jgi:hypothetical protein
MEDDAILSFSPRAKERTMSEEDFQETVVALLKSVDETGKAVLKELRRLNELLEEEDC